MDRRQFGLLGAALAAGLIASRASATEDLAAPIGGNSDGDLKVVAFLDYNCPYCKVASPELARFVAGDGGVRLTYRNWPILGDASIYGAHAALAAAYQGKYETAHRVLMVVPGRRNPAGRMLAAMQAAGLDIGRLDADAATHGAAIQARLADNAAEAVKLALNPVPTIVVGGKRVLGGFDVENFQDYAARARDGQHTAAPVEGP